MNWPLTFQLFALSCGLVAFGLIYLRDRKGEELKGKKLTQGAAKLNVFVPVILMISATVENKQDNNLEAKRDAEYSNLVSHVSLEASNRQTEYTNLIKRLHEEANKRDAAHTGLLSEITGGASWPYVSLYFNPRTKYQRWYIENCGTNPLYDVHVQLRNLTYLYDDLDIYSKRPIETDAYVDAASTFLQLGTLQPEGSRQFNYETKLNPTGNVWNVTINARNGRWSQTIRVDGGINWSQTNYWHQTNSAQLERDEWVRRREREKQARSSK